MSYRVCTEKQKKLATETILSSLPWSVTIHTNKYAYTLTPKT